MGQGGAGRTGAGVAQVYDVFAIGQRGAQQTQRLSRACGALQQRVLVLRRTCKQALSVVAAVTPY
jgi:hypothetical protein